MNKTKVLRADLRGGLGNQMSALVSAQYLAQRTGWPLEVATTGIDRGLADSVCPFGVLTTGTPAMDRSLMGSILHQAIRLARKKLRWDSRAAFGLRRILFGHFLLRGSSQKFCFDTLRQSAQRKVTVSGFFKDCTFFEELSPGLESIFDLEGVPLTPEGERLRLRQIDEKPVGLHLRAKDYLQIPGAVLPLKYYVKAVEEVMSQFGNKPLWIFSDSPMFARNHLSPLLGYYGGEIVSPERSLPSVDSLVLLSRCDALITSNSTFSFWATHLSRPGSVCIAAERGIMSPFQQCEHVARMRE